MQEVWNLADTVTLLSSKLLRPQEMTKANPYQVKLLKQEFEELVIDTVRNLVADSITYEEFQRAQIKAELLFSLLYKAQQTTY